VLSDAGQPIQLLIRFVNNHRVSSYIETSTTGPSANVSYTTSYSYGTPAYNTLGSTINTYDTHTAPSSATVYQNWRANGLNTNSQYLLVHQQWSEFRGHDTVTIVDPNGNQTKHFFYQGDSRTAPWSTACQPTNADDGDACFVAMRNQEFIKGREYLSEVYNGNGAGASKLHATWHSFVVNFDSTLVGYHFSGLWHAFSYENQTLSQTFEGNSSSLNKTTNYTYDPTYGNLVTAQELDQNNNVYRTIDDQVCF